MARGKPSGTRETGKTILSAVLIAGLIRTLAFEPFNIPSGSMMPTLLVGDYLFVSKFTYGYSRYSVPFGLGWSSEHRLFEGAPQRGDVVVFKRPKENKVDYIKRVIGLPGERIQMIGGILHIDGKPVERRRIEDFIGNDRDGTPQHSPQYIETLPGGRQHRIVEYYGDNGPADNTQEFVVPAGHYFMMGDNRDNSQDSRFEDVGYVPAENLVGKAQVLFFSTDGSASLLEVWKWPFAIRYARLFTGIE